MKALKLYGNQNSILHFTICIKSFFWGVPAAKIPAVVLYALLRAGYYHLRRHFVSCIKYSFILCRSAGAESSSYHGSMDMSLRWS
jgi:hypothetical protein